MTALESLNERAAAFTRENYPSCTDRLVFGGGDPDHPRVMLIGEAPGGEEVKAGRPFVGKAGKNLDEFLAAAGLDRNKIWVSNAVKFRPALPGKNGRLRNRAPRESEIVAYRPFLMEEIGLVCPEMLVTLGNTPLFSVCGKGVTVGEYHGRFLDGPDGKKVFCLYHPASVIYRPELKQVYMEDLSVLHSWLHK